MLTSLRVEGANCPDCFNETLAGLADLDGVIAVHGSIDGSRIEIDHDVALDALIALVGTHLHGVEMFANEIQMVPVHAVASATNCDHRQVAGAVSNTTPEPFGTQCIDPAMTLGEIVTRYPSLAAALERRGLDYCCHGGRTLAEAATQAGLDPGGVATDLSTAHIEEPPAEWATLGPLELVNHIEAVHHAYLWDELPRITALIDKIVAAHGDRHPELADVRQLYATLRAELEPHLADEEQRVFPMIRQFTARADRSPLDAETLAQMAALVTEHERVGDLLADLRRVTNHHAVPADGCATYTVCYGSLAALEEDTHLHVHKENNVLFPAIRTRSWETADSNTGPGGAGTSPGPAAGPGAI